MQVKNTYLLSIVLVFIFFSCKSSTNKAVNPDKQSVTQKILPGAYNLTAYLHLLKNKHVAIVSNQTSEINSVHLVDTLLNKGVNIVKVFAPEHGFRGQAAAGEHVADSKDKRTGLSIISLYGKHKKPTSADLQNVEIIVFDIQDVGVRFYTYLSTLHYVMEAAAEQNIPVIVLDRPNPNSGYIDGPVMKDAHKSFVGLHPVPIVYNMTIGEYARMINGEKWLKNGIQTDLTVIPVKNYRRNDTYILPVKPSPNLPNHQAVRLYPSLCLFEGTDVSVGRGTDFPFQVYGSPYLPDTGFQFMPQPNAGSKRPKHQGKVCYGKDLRNITPPTNLHLDWMIETYHQYPSDKKSRYFNKFFNRLAGDEQLQQDIIQGLPVEQIKSKWQKDLNKFKQIRKKYLIYN